VEKCQFYTPPFFCHLGHVLSPFLSAKMRLAGETLCRESTSSNAIEIGGDWKMFSITRNTKGNYDWNAVADGRYYVEWCVGGTRRRSVTCFHAPSKKIGRKKIALGGLWTETCIAAVRHCYFAALTSKRSRFITLTQEFTKSFVKRSCPSDSA